MEKFSKEKTYTYEEIKEIIKNGIEKTVLKPSGKAGEQLKKEQQIKGRHDRFYDELKCYNNMSYIRRKYIRGGIIWEYQY